MDLRAELAAWGPQSPHRAMTLDEARDYCRRLARGHYENFTVVSWLFPRRLHQHLANVYAYCRWADDLADEVGDQAQSLRLLDWWESQLDAMYAGETRHPVFVAISQTVREFGLSRQPLADLLVAFRRDQVQTRYKTLANLLSYCEKSANPVGRVVLCLGRAETDENIVCSDSICTALQLANFCQDVRRDWERGRIYLPQADCFQHGWDESRFVEGRCNDNFRNLLRPLVEDAERRLDFGEPLADRVPQELRLPVRSFVAGGRAILAAIRRERYDVWSSRPTVGRLSKLALLAQAWWSG